MLPASPVSPALPVAAPQCPSHPGRASAATCARCGRFACHECAGHADLCVDCDRLTLPSAAGRARWASRFLTGAGVCMGSMAGVQLVAILQGQSLDAAAEGSLGMALWMLLGGVGTVVCYVASVITYLRWTHRAVGNAQRLGAIPMDPTPGWAVGYWFIPFVNLVAPFRTVRSLYLGLATGQDDRREGLLQVWWGTWLGGNVLENFSTVLAKASPGAGLTLSAVASGLSLVAALLCAWSVRELQRRLEARSAG